MEQTAQDGDLRFRTLDGSDLVAVQRLVPGCPPLTLHTPYTYAVVLGRSSYLCVGAFLSDRLVGVALAIPTAGGCAFVCAVLGVRGPVGGNGRC